MQNWECRRLAAEPVAGSQEFTQKTPSQSGDLTFVSARCIGQIRRR